jgi:hypothetical protein
MVIIKNLGAGVCGAILCVNDYLIIPGSSTDGQVLKVNYLNNNLNVEVKHFIANWGPIIDFQMVDAYEEKQDQLFACTGNALNPKSPGRIICIRNGIAVTKITSIEFADKG